MLCGKPVVDQIFNSPAVSMNIDVKRCVPFALRAGEVGAHCDAGIGVKQIDKTQKLF